MWQYPLVDFMFFFSPETPEILFFITLVNYRLYQAIPGLILGKKLFDSTPGLGRFFRRGTIYQRKRTKKE